MNASWSDLVAALYAVRGETTELFLVTLPLILLGTISGVYGWRMRIRAIEAQQSLRVHHPSTVIAQLCFVIVLASELSNVFSERPYGTVLFLLILLQIGSNLFFDYRTLWNFYKVHEKAVKQSNAPDHNSRDV